MAATASAQVFRGSVRQVPPGNEEPLAGLLEGALLVHGALRPITRFEVKQGEFAITANEDTNALVVYSATLCGVRMWPVVQTHALSPGSRLVISLTTVPQLHVFDVETRRELDVVQYACPRRELGSLRSLFPHLGETRERSPVSTTTAAPMSLVHFDAWCTYLVTSPGYAWAPLPIEPDAPSRVDVFLSKAGVVELTVETNAQSLGPECRVQFVRQDSGYEGIDYEISLANLRSFATIEKLLPGTYSVRVTDRDPIGVWLESTHQTVVIRAGETAKVAVRLGEDMGHGAEGVLIVHGDASALREVTEIRLLPRDGVAADRAEQQRTLSVSESSAPEWADYKEWTLRGLTPGLYEIEVLPWGFIDYQRIGDAPTFAIDVLLPRPVRYQIAVLDADTGSYVKDVGYWVKSSDMRHTDLLLRAASLGRGDGTDNPFEVTKLEGMLRISAMDLEHVHGHWTMDGSAGQRSIVLSIDRPRTLVLSVAAAGQDYLRSNVWWGLIETAPVAPNNGRLTSSRLEESNLQGWHSAIELTFSKSGRYQVGFPPLDSGAVVPDIEVIVSERPERCVVDFTRWLIMRDSSVSEK